MFTPHRSLHRSPNTGDKKGGNEKNGAAANTRRRFSRILWFYFGCISFRSENITTTDWWSEEHRLVKEVTHETVHVFVHVFRLWKLEEVELKPGSVLDFLGPGQRSTRGPFVRTPRQIVGACTRLSVHPFSLTLSGDGNDVVELRRDRKWRHH